MTPRPTIHSFTGQRQPARRPAPTRVAKCQHSSLQVEAPRVQPKLSEPFLGFTQTAEIWNSRACMIGLIGTFIVELVLNKGILQMIGVEVGKGLDLPL
ncbi:light-harvesting complex-like protein OHP1, chloroplastic [Zea mays]|uniref:light-harvesting complex-like protein OHP1, chloroplastic n=1 Tax=Zea mays TaxID=4577 RepID=UPI000221E5C6|nr:light-harvesting complex-like protein OHP1, chloroplastic [Zea mays]|eukprot:XP_008659081.1 light-harvesting complex-like protein OHP1, chloroplastic [Zea mays]